MKGNFFLLKKDELLIKQKVNFNKTQIKRRIWVNLQVHFVLSFFLIFFIGCKNNSIELNNEKVELIDTLIAVQDTNVLSRLYFKQVNHKFSNIEVEDTFKLIVIGRNLNDAIVVFSIKAKEYGSIYQNTFSTSQLFSYDYHGKTDKEAEIYIKERLEKFFDANNFLIYPLDNDEGFEDFTIEENWNEIKQDKTSIGFDYLVGEEDRKRIAFSKRLKKVVLYYNCC